MLYLKEITALSLNVLVLSTTFGSGMVQMPWEGFGERSMDCAEQYFVAARKHCQALTTNDIESPKFLSEDHFYVTDVDLSGSNGADELIKKLVKCPSLSSLLKVNLANSDVSLDGLNMLKELKPKKGFVRPHLQASARYGMQVAVVEVNVSGTQLARKNVWELNNKISIPTKEVLNVTYLNDGDSDFVHLQVLPRF